MKPICSKMLIRKQFFLPKISGKQGSTRPDQALGPKGNVQPQVYEVPAMSSNLEKSLLMQLHSGLDLWIRSTCSMFCVILHQILQSLHLQPLLHESTLRSLSLSLTLLVTSVCLVVATPLYLRPARTNTGTTMANHLTNSRVFLPEMFVVA